MRPRPRDEERKGPAQPASPLTPVLQASTALPIPLRVELESFDIDLGGLLSMRPGDVLRTGHALKAPLIIRDAGPAERMDGVGDSPPVCVGYLGMQAGARAVGLLRQN